jgi:hypothetical protein
MNIFERTLIAADGMPERTPDDIFGHLRGEVEELNIELFIHRVGQPAGPDGIAGEIIDCIACLVDLYQQHDPNSNEEEFIQLYQKKLDKWKEKYSEPVDESFLFNFQDNKRK